MRWTDAPAAAVLLLVLVSPAVAQWSPPVLESVWPCISGSRSYGVAVDASGRSIVSDYANGRLLVRDRDGSLLASWGGIQKFDPDGLFLAQWTVPHPGTGTKPVPRGVFVDEQDRVHVTDYLNARVLVFTTSGALIGAWDTSGPDGWWGANDLDIDPQGRIVLVGGDCRVKVFVRDGATAAPRVSWGALKQRYR